MEVTNANYVLMIDLALKMKKSRFLANLQTVNL